jgi:hypothetical protein
MNRKETLVNSLRVAVNALKNDTIYYDWNKQCSCNAGVISQAVLGITSDELEKKRKSLFSVISEKNEGRRSEDKDYIDHTWKNAVQYGCPITGKNMPEIVRDLEAAGLTREDIVHLEYLENPAILEASTIEKVKTVVGKNQVGTIKEERTRKKFLGLIKETYMEEVPVYENVYEEKYPAKYFMKKENVIKYLSAWIKILTENVNYSDNRNELEANLLNAVAEERYEDAAEIRNRLVILN